ncbi:methionine-rich copper-binding protein CopC [Actinokineospora baliensis]|uniref:copper resistance CopC family protein n=1 Tax=Actinokineospora baliensis TaxID=547056 RepID=UPI00195682E5|nr:copper resistance CopC family protein [Actinokineospora baliensis]MBM7769817.1 methionine-rich copper-binding protein CopC [Actinokineospora baliensis]
MSFRRLAATLLLAGAAVLGTALPASAHVELKSSDPAEGASLAQLPTALTLTFTEAVTAKVDAVAVSSPGGLRWTVGTPTVAGTVVTVPVQPVGPAGPYTIEYRVNADDGHTVSGAINFTLAVDAPAPTTTTEPSVAATTPEVVATEATQQPPAAQPAAAETGVPTWIWFVVGLVVLVAIVVGLLLRSRRASTK